MPTNSIASSQIATRIQRPLIRQMPMKHSSAAMARMLTYVGDEYPNVSRCVEAFVRFSAGLTPGRELQQPEPEEDGAHGDAQDDDAVRDELMMDHVLDVQNVISDSAHARDCEAVRGPDHKRRPAARAADRLGRDRAGTYGRGERWRIS